MTNSVSLSEKNIDLNEKSSRFRKDFSYVEWFQTNCGRKLKQIILFERDWLQKVAFHGNIVCTAPDEKIIKKKKRPAHRSAALNNLIERSKLDNAAKYHDLEVKGQWCANLNNMKGETIC